jgi:hypothetical protein
LFVTIIGGDHGLQEKDSSGDFRKLIENFIDQSPVDVIAEEAKQNYETIPRQIAGARSIPWLGVDLNLADRKRLKIDDELNNRPWCPIYSDTAHETAHLGDKRMYLPNADTIREQFWVSRTLESGASTALFICGFFHLQKVSDKFMAAGCEVAQVNVCELNWYKRLYGEIKLFTKEDGSLWYESRYVKPTNIY